MNNKNSLSECILEILSECNYKCKHCYRQESEPLTTEQIFIIIDKLKRIGIKRLTILGGEPTLRKDLYDILEYAISNVKEVNIETNGSTKTFFSPYKCNVCVSFEYPDKKQI
jgi:MoaA/NifB/PqqE/SkfB family radical SAM enzyme